MFQKILVPVDLAVPEDAQTLLTAARDLGQVWQAELHVVTVIPNMGMAIVGGYFDDSFEAKSRAAATAHLQESVTKANMTANLHVLTGTVYDCVIALASEIAADLIVIGAHQPKLRDYLLGANAAKVVRHAHQSVLVIRDKG